MEASVSLTKVRQATHTTPVLSLTYTIGTLASLTGLSTHTIRAWERRYSALEPERTGTNRRVYTAQDVERLNLLRQSLALGHSIGQIASLSTDQLRAIIGGSRSKVRTPLEAPYEGAAVAYLEACQIAVQNLDAEGLEESLVRGNAALGVLGLLDGVVIPLLEFIERGWTNGLVRISHEHLASAVLRTFLDRLRISMPVAGSAPRLLVTTPANQHHEIGALMVAIVAATQVWTVTYLGPNLPATEIAHAAKQCSASAIGLSLVFPTDDPAIPDELLKLRSLVGPMVPIIVGGRASEAYATPLQEINALVSQDLWSLRQVLRQAALIAAA